MNLPIPHPDPDVCEQPRRRIYAIQMKSGEVIEATLDRIEPIGSLGLSFIVDDVSVGGVAFGTFAEWHEIGISDGPDLHIRRSAPAKPPELSTGGPKGGRIRRVGINAPGDPLSKPLKKLLELLPDLDVWVSLKQLRATFKEEYGGFPPRTYEAFNNAIAQGKHLDYIEVDDVR